MNKIFSQKQDKLPTASTSFRNDLENCVIVTIGLKADETWKNWKNQLYKQSFFGLFKAGIPRIKES